MKHQFEPVSWMDHTNVYEVNTRQYTREGTFNAFAAHIPRLQNMGVKVIWLIPVTPISLEQRQGSLGSYYACSSYTAINPEFGTLDDFKALVQTVHGHGMKLIIDWVANHTGRDHHWIKEHPEWYITDEAGNFTERNGWVDVIDLDYRNHHLHKAMIKAMQFWVETCDIDGFRCDMAHLVPLNFWKEARKQCDHIKPLLWLAETESVEYHEVFDISYAWEWMHVSEKQAKAIASVQHLKDILHKYANYPPGAKKLFFTSNHDENSWNGTEYEKYGTGAKAYAVFSCTWPGVPLIYSGQELPNHKRLKFFDKDTIEWTSQPQLQEFYTLLLQLRNTHPACTGNASVTLLETGADENVMAYLLMHQHHKILVVLNLSDNDRQHVLINHDKLEGVYRQLFSGICHTLKNRQAFELQAWEYFVYATPSE